VLKVAGSSGLKELHTPLYSTVHAHHLTSQQLPLLLLLLQAPWAVKRCARPSRWPAAAGSRNSNSVLNLIPLYAI
jgi:hypothetical protein